MSYTLLTEKIRKNQKLTVAMLGTLPPQKALSPYCLALVTALDPLASLFFHSFSRLYPVRLHPSKEAPEDVSFPKIKAVNLKVFTWLTWYNPFSWIKAGMAMKTKIFHVQWWSLPTLPALISMIFFARLKKIPVVVTVHNVSPHEPSHFFDWSTRLVIHFSDHLIVHTNSNKRTLLHKYPVGSNHISVIPHGPLNFFKTGTGNFRRTEQIKGHEKLILFFGTIRPYKGLDILLEAFSAVKKKLPVRLVIAGSLWEDWDRYSSMIHQLGLDNDVINLTGYVPADRVGSLFSAADLVVLPYKHFDSQSGVGATAVAFNVPMIVTDTGGLPELVNDPECVVSCNNPEALAEKMTIVLSDEKLQKKLKNDAQTIQKKISWECIARQTVSLYHQILDDHRQ